MPWWPEIPQPMARDKNHHQWAKIQLMWRFKYCHEMQLHCQLVATILSYLMILGVLCQHFQKPQSEKDTVWGVEDMDFHQHQWLVENDVDEVWMMPSWTEHDAVMWLHLLTTAPCEELGSAYQQPDAANWPLAYLKAPPIAARPTKNVTVLLFSLNSDSWEKKSDLIWNCTARLHSAMCFPVVPVHQISMTTW